MFPSGRYETCAPSGRWIPFPPGVSTQVGDPLIDPSPDSPFAVTAFAPFSKFT